jgi:WD40 repeat protein
MNKDLCKHLKLISIYRCFLKYENGKADYVKHLDLDEPLRSVSWNHLKPHICAAGSFSGKIRIVNADSYTIAQELTGCSDKILSIKWHPSFDYILASGSSDNFVRVWDTKNVSLHFINSAREWAQEP